MAVWALEERNRGWVLLTYPVCKLGDRIFGLLQRSDELRRSLDKSYTLALRNIPVSRERGCGLNCVL